MALIEQFLADEQIDCPRTAPVTGIFEDETPPCLPARADGLAISRGGQLTVDRRRPGRRDVANPHLIAMMRGVKPGATRRTGYVARPCQGILLAVLLSAPVWVGIGFLVF